MFWLWSTYCSSYAFFPLLYCFGTLHIYKYISPPTEIQKQISAVALPQKWSMMRACRDHSNDLNMSGSFTPSLIRPQPLITSSTPSHGFGHVSKESSKDCDSAQAPVSSRWNPTPQQVEVLKEMFRLGTRSPTAEHIQQITTLLRRFGRVEGKNVFYWFQNHKARERQKRRCSKLETSSQEQKCYITESRERKKPGVRRAWCEVEESSHWGPLPISVCNLLSEEPDSVHGTQTSSNLHHITPITQLALNPDAANTLSHGNQQQRQYQMLELFPLGKGSNNVSEEQSQVSITTTTTGTSFSPSQFVEFLPPKV